MKNGQFVPASLALLLVFTLSLPAPSPALLAGEGEPKAGKDDDEGKDEGQEEKPGGGEDEEDEPARPALTDREKNVLGLFNARARSFKDGRLVLVYDFQTRKDEQLEDWKPSLEEARPRIRWSAPKEGPSDRAPTSSSDTKVRYLQGIVLGDHGQWLHKAVFLPDVEVTVDLLNYAQPREGSLLGPVFFSEKKRSSIGVNDGNQAVCLNGWKPARAPYPKAEKPIPYNVRHQVGYRLKGKSFDFFRGDKKSGDASTLPKFTEGYDSGHVGLAWNGSIRGFIFRVTIVGQLDPDWVSAELGEKAQDSSGKGKAAR